MHVQNADPQAAEPPLRILLISPGDAADPLAAEIVDHFRPEGKEVVIKRVGDEKSHEEIERLVDKCDGAIALLEPHEPGASPTRSLPFEVGFWVGRRGSKRFVLLKHQYTGPMLFINYRHDDTGEVAGRIKDRFQVEFGESAVFQDIDNIERGSSIPKAIGDSLRKATHFLVLVGKEWLDPGEGKEQSRLYDLDDYVRREIELALFLGKTVFVVCVDGGEVPKADKIPSILGPITNDRVFKVTTGETFKEDMKKLVKAIRESETGGRRMKDEPIEHTATQKVFDVSQGGWENVLDIFVANLSALRLTKPPDSLIVRALQKRGRELTLEDYDSCQEYYGCSFRREAIDLTTELLAVGNTNQRHFEVQELFRRIHLHTEVLIAIQWLGKLRDEDRDNLRKTQVLVSGSLLDQQHVEQSKEKTRPLRSVGDTLRRLEDKYGEQGDLAKASRKQLILRLREDLGQLKDLLKVLNADDKTPEPNPWYRPWVKFLANRIAHHAVHKLQTRNKVAGDRIPSNIEDFVLSDDRETALAEAETKVNEFFEWFEELKEYVDKARLRAQTGDGADGELDRLRKKRDEYHQYLEYGLAGFREAHKGDDFARENDTEVERPLEDCAEFWNTRLKEDVSEFAEFVAGALAGWGLEYFLDCRKRMTDTLDKTQNFRPRPAEFMAGLPHKENNLPFDGSWIC